MDYEEIKALSTTDLQGIALWATIELSRRATINESSTAERTDALEWDEEARTFFDDDREPWEIEAHTHEHFGVGARITEIKTGKTGIITSKNPVWSNRVYVRFDGETKERSRMIRKLTALEQLHLVEEDDD